MTENDINPSPLPGQWMQVNDAVTPSGSPATTTPRPTVLMRSTETTTPTTGITIDPAMIIPLILLLGAVAGIILMLILDKYFPPERISRARIEKTERTGRGAPYVTLEYTE